MFKNMGTTAYKVQFTLDRKLFCLRVCLCRFYSSCVFSSVLTAFLLVCSSSSSTCTLFLFFFVCHVVKEVILPDMFDDFDGSETLCLAFERGKGKDLTYTDEKKISLSDNDEIVADFNKESLTCDVTLHRDNKTGLFRVRS
jgi:hypothetical protein